MNTSKEKQSSYQCKVEDCSKLVKSKGLCATHYMQVRRHGAVQVEHRQMPNTFEVVENECIIGLRDMKGVVTAYARTNAEFTDAVSQYKWSLSGNGYVQCVALKTYLHRFVLCDPFMVDHINGDKLNCTLDNLRVCDHSTNAMNRGKQINNKSGYKGVIYNKQCRRWQAFIASKNLGLFTCRLAAAWTYNINAIKDHGEFANLNTL